VSARRGPTFDANYDDRDGFDVGFLRPGKLDGRVFLPTLSAALAAQAAPLLGKNKGVVLAYHHYSVVLHKVRRFAIYSAASIDFSGRFSIPRKNDVWRIDPRIPAELQVTAACYENNQFDRGHLTRREDLEYGATEADAMVAANDTCHWTNCTPQAAKFNEGKQLWAGLELHILEQAVEKNRFRAQVITGPVFGTRDPVIPGFPGLRYPLRYWKVVAAINASDRLFATAYVLDQRGQIAPATRGAPEVPFTAYKTFQTTIANVEALTDLSFTCGQGAKRVALKTFDPLAKAKVVGGYLPLETLDDVVLSA
jgi:endonuclease G, mitochondrial